MHPFLMNRRRTGLYLLGWGPITAMLAAVLLVAGQAPWSEVWLLSLPLGLVSAFLCLAAWVPCRAYPLEAGRLHIALTVHLTTAVLTASAWVALGRGLAHAVERWWSFPGAAFRMDQVAVPLMTFGTLIYLLSVAVHYLLVAFEASREAERRALEAVVAARNAELELLRAQLNPHFLFNSLNSIASLTVPEPAAARVMCIQLGDFLRATLKLSSSSMVPLTTELELVGRYLCIEKVRFGDRLTVEVDTDEDCADIPVPALVLQPLVENAIKHGIATLIEGGVVRITCTRTEGRLRVRVTNPVDPDAPQKFGGGAGLGIVRSRLRTTYGGGAGVRTTRDDTEYRAELIIPLEDLP